MKGVFMLMIFVSLVSLCQGGGCDCAIEHSQTLICMSDFALDGTIVSATPIEDFYRYEVRINQLFKGHDLVEDGVERLEIYTPYMTGLCGRSNLSPEEEYFISGSYLEGKFVTTLCDWVEVWKDVTPSQKQFLTTKEYFKHCSTCGGKIIGVKVALSDKSMGEDLKFPGMVSGLWTPNGCHFNPVASITYSDEDCETAYSYCRVSERREGQCDWERTPDYVECFDDREADWAKKKRPGPAAAMVDPVRVSDCRRLKSKRMKKKCLRRLKAKMRANKGAEEPAVMLMELMEIRDMFLDDQLFED